MDNLTHTLFAVTLARTPLGRAGRGTTTALILASNAPDIDIVTTAARRRRLSAVARGPTHGPLGIVGLGVADRRRSCGPIQRYADREERCRPDDEPERVVRDAGRRVDRRRRCATS